MYNLNKKKCVIVLAALFFSVAASTMNVYADKSDRDYDYEDSYNNDYLDRSDFDYKDRSDYDYENDQDSDINLDDVRQNNKNGDNYIIVESKQESITEKITNFADKFLKDENGHSYFNPDFEREDTRGYGASTDFALNVLIGFNERYDINDIPDIKVTANGEKQILKGSDIGESQDGYYALQAFFSFDRIYKESIKVCILPEDAPEEFKNCKDVEVRNGNEKTVRFFVS